MFVSRSILLGMSLCWSDFILRYVTGIKITNQGLWVELYNCSHDISSETIETAMIPKNSFLVRAVIRDHLTQLAPNDQMIKRLTRVRVTMIIWFLTAFLLAT